MSVLIVAATTACGASTSPVSALFDAFGSRDRAKVEVIAEGGIAGLAITRGVNHNDRAFVYTQGRICSTNCPPPLDSTSGTLSSPTTDSLFNIVFEQLRVTPKDDYGTTPHAADLMNYTVRVTQASAVRTIRADDGTIPTSVRVIVDAMRETIDAARR